MSAVKSEHEISVKEKMPGRESAQDKGTFEHYDNTEIKKKTRKRTLKKKKNSTGRIVALILSVTLISGLLISSVTFNVLQYYKNKRTIKELSSLQQQTSVLNEENKKLTETVREQKEIIENKDDAITKQSDTISSYETDIASLQTKNNQLSFYEKNAVIVPNDESGLYHKYGCNKLSMNSGYWIFNTGAAQTEGYLPCEKCIN